MFNDKPGRLCVLFLGVAGRVAKTVAERSATFSPV